MQLPESDTLNTKALGKIFDNTVATYKFYWFMSILQIHAKTGQTKIDVNKILIQMVANAWHPALYFKLSFGKSDSLPRITHDISRWLDIAPNAKTETIVRTLKANSGETCVRQALSVLDDNVPYRFLSPWISKCSDKDMVVRSQLLENDSLYSIHREPHEFYILINPRWDHYLHQHFQILMGFAQWHLARFLQVRNPNVPAIASKLTMADSRSSLNGQHRYWDMLMQGGLSVQCIYTRQPLQPGDYDLDHFMPWRFVCHDLLWNLVPSSPSVNSSKSDRIPDLDTYLSRLAALQQQALQQAVGLNRPFDVLDDFATLGYSPYDLATMSRGAFLSLYERTYKPLSQIALNMGFESWKY